MSVPILDLNLKHIVDFTIQTVMRDPDKYLKEIFGDARLEPHAILYGDNLIQEIKDWIMTTKIPVVLGFELDPTQIPAITIHLERNAPAQPFLGDAGLTYSEDIPDYKRTVLVSKFIPKDVLPEPDYSFTTILLPDDFTSEQRQLVSPGLRIRDKNGKEYGIGENGSNPTAVQIQDKLTDADFSEMEVISPYKDVIYRQGAMLYDENALITVHGHSNRSEGLWLWAIVQWGLLKFRPLLTQLFGIDLAFPSASDFIKDDSFLGENVWRRFITLSAKVVWSWEGPQQSDALAFILYVKGASSDTAAIPPKVTDLS